MKDSGSCTGGFTTNGDVVRVAAKLTYMPASPFYAIPLIKQPGVESTTSFDIG
jgi:hypothetical protein